MKASDRQCKQLTKASDWHLGEKTIMCMIPYGFVRQSKRALRVCLNISQENFAHEKTHRHIPMPETHICRKLLDEKKINILDTLI